MLMKLVDPAQISAKEACESKLQNGRTVMEDISKVMLSITKLALSCCKQVPTKRMCTRDVGAEMRTKRDHHVKRRETE
uniref:Uncharacterized protein n=1 Tax=Arundo donax TaxID=35708 RepID=A0A0A8ZHL6_ARUDO